MAKKAKSKKSVTPTAIIYTVRHAGRTASGDRLVTIEDTAATAAVTFTDWPTWAYKLALFAILHGRQLYVVYKGGSPSGVNLEQVTIYA